MSRAAAVNATEDGLTVMNGVGVMLAELIVSLKLTCT